MHMIFLQLNFASAKLPFDWIVYFLTILSCRQNPDYHVYIYIYIYIYTFAGSYALAGLWYRICGEVDRLENVEQY